MTRRLRRIAASPFVTDVRSGRLDTHIGVVLGAVFVIAVAWVTRGLVWVPTP